MEDFAKAIAEAATLWLTYTNKSGSARECVQAVTKASQFLRDPYMHRDEPGFVANAERQALLYVLSHLTQR